MSKIEIIYEVLTKRKTLGQAIANSTHKPYMQMLNPLHKSQTLDVYSDLMQQYLTKNELTADYDLRYLMYMTRAKWQKVIDKCEVDADDAPSMHRDFVCAEGTKCNIIKLDGYDRVPRIEPDCVTIGCYAGIIEHIATLLRRCYEGVRDIEYRRSDEYGEPHTGAPVSNYLLGMRDALGSIEYELTTAAYAIGWRRANEKALPDIISKDRMSSIGDRHIADMGQHMQPIQNASVREWMMAYVDEMLVAEQASDIIRYAGETDSDIARKRVASWHVIDEIDHLTSSFLNARTVDDIVSVCASAARLSSELADNVRFYMHSLSVTIDSDIDAKLRQMALGIAVG